MPKAANQTKDRLLCLRGVLGVLLIFACCSRSLAQNVGSSSPAASQEPKTLRVLIRPFTAAVTSDIEPRLQNHGKDELRTALTDALGKARDLKIEVLDREDLPEMVQETGYRQQYAYAVKGPIRREIEATDYEYVIKTSYVKQGLRFRIDATVVKIRGLTQIGPKYSIIDVSDPNPLGVLGAQLLESFRDEMGIHLRTVKLHIPCFDITGRDVPADSLKVYEKMARGAVKTALTGHAMVFFEQNCEGQESARINNGRELYLIGVIVVQTTFDKQSGQNGPGFFLQLLLRRGTVELMTQQEQCADQAALIKVAGTLGYQVTLELEGPDIQSGELQ